MGLIFRLFAVTGLVFTLSVVALIGLGGYLLFAGGGTRPDCAPPEGSAFERTAASLAFDARLVVFVATLGRSPLGEASFGEMESAARAERFFSEERISDIALCFEDGKARGFVKVETAFGRKVGVNAEGTLDLSGDHPVLKLSRARAAGVAVPWFLRGELEDRVNDRLDDIFLVFPMRLSFSGDRVIVSREP